MTTHLGSVINMPKTTHSCVAGFWSVFGYSCDITITHLTHRRECRLPLLPSIVWRVLTRNAAWPAGLLVCCLWFQRLQFLVSPLYHLVASTLHDSTHQSFPRTLFKHRLSPSVRAPSLTHGGGQPEGGQDSATNLELNLSFLSRHWQCLTRLISLWWNFKTSWASHCNFSHNVIWMWILASRQWNEGQEFSSWEEGKKWA